MTQNKNESENQTQEQHGKQGQFFTLETRTTTRGKPIRVLSLPLVEASCLLVVVLMIAAVIGGVASSIQAKNNYQKATVNLVQGLLDAEQLSGKYKADALAYLSRQGEAEDRTEQQ